MRSWSTDSTDARSYVISHEDSLEHVQAELEESSASCAGGKHHANLLVISILIDLGYVGQDGQ